METILSQPPLAAAVAHSAIPDALRAADILRILVCRTSHSLGNTLLVTPLLQELEATWPGAEVDVITRNAAATELFANFANVRHVHCLPRRAAQRPLQALRALQAIRAQQYDLAIDTDARSRTGRALLAQCRARFKLGFVSAQKSRGVTHGVGVDAAPAHMAQRPVHLLRSALQHAKAGFPDLDLRLSAAERAQGADILARLLRRDPGASPRPTIGIFANATGPKLLDRAWWREFMPHVEAAYPGFDFIEIAPASGQSLLDSRFPVYYSSHLRRLASVLSNLSLLVCLDCGVMHLARASGTRTAAVFTVTDASQWGPYGDGACVVPARDVAPAEAARRLIDAVPAARLADIPA